MQLHTKNTQVPERIEKEYTLVSLPLAGYRLTLETLAAHTHPSHLRKRTWDRPDVQFDNWQEGTMEFRLTWRSQSQRFLLRVLPGQLLVGCSCQSREPELCLHAGKALQSFIWYSGEDCFENCRPGGEVAIAFEHRKYFTITWSFYRFYVSPKKDLGRVYIPGTCRQGWLTKSLPTPSTISAEGSHTKTASYIIVAFHRKEMLPVLIPCMGTLSKDGRFIKSFEPFFSATKKEYDHLLTEDQKALNQLCYQMWQAAETLPGTVLEEGRTENRAKEEILFNLWKRAFSGLLSQSHVYSYRAYRKRELKAKPEKKKIQKIHPCMGQPSLGFTLRQREDFYLLTGTARTSGGRLIPHFDAGLPFFLCERDNIYFLSSLNDAIVANRIRKTDHKMTVFKEHFPVFEKEVLQELERVYPVKRLQR